jgi:hypothetical protein
LCCQVAGFTAGAAVILAVFTKAGIVRTLAKTAVALARTAFFREVADAADELLRHGARLDRFSSSGNDTLVLHPVGPWKPDDPVIG